MRRSVVVFALTVACSSPAGPADHPAPTANGDAPGPSASDPWYIGGPLEREKLPASMPDVAFTARPFPKLPRGIAAPPASCGAFVERAPVGTARCEGRDQALEALATALTSAEAERDGRLGALEAGCAPLPAGFVRALRIELAPLACADALARPWLAKPLAGVSGIVHDTIFGLGLAGMLSRSATEAPRPKTSDKEALERFAKGEMRSWLSDQAAAIQELSVLGSKLGYYGRAVAAIEAGMADMRFIEAVRAVPVPAEFSQDAELGDVHVQGLERALEARKTRGRDAILVGLGNLAAIGLVRDARVDRARALLSSIYGGSPVDALDKLLLAEQPVSRASSTKPKLAALLPTFYASLVFSPVEAKEVLFAAGDKGIALPQRIALAGIRLDEASTLAYARARFELGRRFWRRVDINEAIVLLKGVKLDDASRLLLATAIALRNGPANPAEMMIKAPLRKLGIGNIRALGALEGEGGPYAGHAAFNAAYISKLAAPADASAAYWQEVAARFRAAATKLRDPVHKRLAAEGAKEAEDTAKVIPATKGAGNAPPSSR
jgi:hypothetical protein